MKFAERLASLMKERNLNADDIAKYAECHRATVFRYLRTPDYLPPLKSLIGIANGLGVSLDYLVGLSEIPYKRSCEDEFCYILHKVYARATDRDKQIVGMILNHYLTDEEVGMNYDLS